MKTANLLKQYRTSNLEYASTLLTAITALGENGVLAKLEEAEKQGKRLWTHLPYDPSVGPSEPDGVVIV